jgi:tetratricopeptide (TPR) repeat protein
MKKILLSLLIGASVALAAGTIQDAKNLYAKGEFLKASTTAAELNTAEGEAFAAKALSLYAATQPEKSQDELYSKAETYARAAIKLNPKYAEGYMEVARALGRLSQLRGVLTALSQGYGNQIRDNIEKCLEYDKDHAGAMIAYGLWHSEIIAKGVAWLYGADSNKAIEYFKKAIKLEPKTIIHRVEYARGLTLLDKKKYLNEAVDQLEVAVGLTPNDAAEKLDLARAERELASLKSGK